MCVCVLVCACASVGARERMKREFSLLARRMRSERAKLMERRENQIELAASLVSLDGDGDGHYAATRVGQRRWHSPPAGRCLPARPGPGCVGAESEASARAQARAEPEARSPLIVCGPSVSVS